MQEPKGIRHKHERLHYRGVSIKVSELILGLAFPGRIVLSLIERCPYKVRLDSASFPAFYVFYVREYARKNYAKVEIHPDSSLHRGVYSLNFIRLLRVVITPSVTEGVITTQSNQMKFRLRCVLNPYRPVNRRIEGRETGSLGNQRITKKFQ